MGEVISMAVKQQDETETVMVHGQEVELQYRKQTNDWTYRANVTTAFRISSRAASREAALTEATTKIEMINGAA